MRRPLLLVFIILIIFSIIKTKNDDYFQREENIEIYGVVKLKVEKENYIEYDIDKFLVRDYNRKFEVNVGDIVYVNGKIKDLAKISSSEFNYINYIKGRGYEGLVYSSYYEVVGYNEFYIFLNNIFLYMKDTTRYLYKENSDFINSLLLGLKTDLSEEESDMFSKTGTSHIVAISGMHIGILASIIILFFGKINRIYKIILVLIISVFYSIMIGFSPSIIRAIGFMGLNHFSYFIDMKNDSISNLSLIGILFVTNNPYIIYNVSFQLSFLGMLSIAYFYRIINKKINNKFISITLSANILTLPVVYYIFGNVSLLSIFGNLIVSPFIAIIIYLSIMSILLFKINLFFCDIIVSVNRFIINAIYFLLDKVSNIEFLYFEFYETNFLLVVIYYIVIFSYIIYYETYKTVKNSNKERTFMNEEENRGI